MCIINIEYNLPYAHPAIYHPKTQIGCKQTHLTSINQQQLQIIKALRIISQLVAANTTIHYIQATNNLSNHSTNHNIGVNINYTYTTLQSNMQNTPDRQAQANNHAGYK
eukprot:gene2669-1667_t